MAAFSNGTAWDCWSSQWCAKCENDINEDCEIVMTAFMGDLPEQWIPNKPLSLYEQYICTEFKEIV
jgi:hypothetical protein